ncbi:MAG: diphthine--ammonia ligase [Leptospiraceae bacterium]|nr:diphthine--ammonia ligase [Leptospiraceae bacterium]
MSTQKTYFNWSSGKDSALALHYLLQDQNYQIKHLVTSVNTHHNRVSMHGVRRELLVSQIESIGIPFSTIELPEEPDMEIYQKKMDDCVSLLKAKGFEHTAFGDIFLEDLRKYREDKLSKYNIKAHFPLWKRDTNELINEFIDLGFQAIVVCVQSNLLGSSFVGRMIDKDFIKELPKNVDPCGENGEFHTFCFDGPIFQSPIPFVIGEKVYKEYKDPKNEKNGIGFWFCDLLPDSQE